MSRVVIAVVYAVEVLPGEDDVQEATFERFVSDLPTCPNAEILFASGVLAAAEREMADPDFDVDVRAHGRPLERIPFE